MLTFVGGNQHAVDDLASAMLLARDREGVEGISMLGGEPVAHLGGAIALAERAQAASLSVMVYSGYTIDEIRASGARRLLDVTDVLVDGPYRRDQPEPRRRWVGSANQRVHLLTSRYSPDDPCWTRPNTLEIRIRDGELMVNGFPSPAAVAIWRRPTAARAGHD